MKNIEIKEIVCLTSTKVVERKTNTGNETAKLEHVDSAMQWLCKKKKKYFPPDRPNSEKVVEDK